MDTVKSSVSEVEKIYILKFWLKIKKNSSYLVFASTLGQWIWDLSGSIWHNVAVYEKWNIKSSLANKQIPHIHVHTWTCTIDKNLMS